MISSGGLGAISCAARCTPRVPWNTPLEQDVNTSEKIRTNANQREWPDNMQTLLLLQMDWERTLLLLHLLNIKNAHGALPQPVSAIIHQRTAISRNSWLCLTVLYRRAFSLNFTDDVIYR